MILLILTSFCVAQSAEHEVIAASFSSKLVEKISQQSQMAVDETCALVMEFLMQGIDKLVEQQQKRYFRMHILEIRAEQVDRCKRQQMLLQSNKVIHVQQPKYYKNNNRIKQQRHAQHNKCVQQPKPKHRRRG